MFDESTARANWRRSLEGLSAAEVDELETHVVDALAAFDAKSLTEEERFHLVTRRLGAPEELAAEHAKMSPWSSWNAPIFWSAVGVIWALGMGATLDLLHYAAWQLTHSLPSVAPWMLTSVVYVGGPVVTFVSVAAWMRSRSANDRATRVALCVTVSVLALVAAGTRCWWQLGGSAVSIGVCAVVALGLYVLFRFRAVLVGTKGGTRTLTGGYPGGF